MCVSYLTGHVFPEIKCRDLHDREVTGDETDGVGKVCKFLFIDACVSSMFLRPSLVSLLDPSFSEIQMTTRLNLAIRSKMVSCL